MEEVRRRNHKLIEAVSEGRHVGGKLILVVERQVLLDAILKLFETLVKAGMVLRRLYLEQVVPIVVEQRVVVKQNRQERAGHAPLVLDILKYGHIEQRKKHSPYHLLTTFLHDEVIHLDHILLVY